ncbi:MAG: S-methyl-5-thioribose-1-phosphate isomerase [Spirochaetales bacterium]|nr:S-methyl-5-thioribose-1-phosphate isomerase [Spirochaetales bacterium]
MIVKGKHYKTVWLEGNTVKIINQAVLPHKFEITECPDHQRTARAISTMIIRGAGAIGTAAGFGMAQAVLEAPEKDFEAYIRNARTSLRNTRPTAQNLFYSIERVFRCIQETTDPEQARIRAVMEAEAIALEDINACKQIGEIGAKLIQNNFKVLTHCNAGWLAFTDWGTALSPIYVAKREHKNIFVWVDETRPRFQGARLTAWELQEEQIPYAVIADNAAGFYMQRGEVDLVIVGSDRIARNGDVANKIGTYEKAVLAKEHDIPFYVAAPTSTIDWDCTHGGDIPIEERSESEVVSVTGRDEVNNLRTVFIVPEGAKARNPAFDVTPAAYITGIITEKGIVAPEKLAKLKNK